MRPGYRTTFEQYGKISKEMSSPDDEPAQNLASALDSQIRRVAQESGTSEQVQFEIFSLQQEKQRIMDELHVALKRVDEKESEKAKSKNAREISFDGETYSYQTRGESVAVTQGDILTDGEWGAEYVLDAETVPRTLRKRYLIETAKRKLLELADRQILRITTTSTKVTGGRKESYQAISEGGKEKKEMQSGHIAEKIVRTFLAKISIDVDIGLEIVTADVQQDVEQKIDFIIRRTDHRRGVRIDSGEGVETLGIQYTSDPEERTRKRKQHQIDDAKQRNLLRDVVDDLILVQIPLDDVKALMWKWKQAGQPPGGPSQFMSDDMKQQIFHGSLRGIIAAPELKEAWKKVVSQS